MQLQVIARLKGDFPTKFGLPRQSGLVDELQSLVVMEPEYADPNALRGLEGFSHVWLIWGFSEVKQTQWSPTVRPPRLGGNARMGVFATRAPYRPNPLGLSCVRLCGICEHKGRPALLVAGADLMDGTPIYDIKPYLTYADSHPDARDGFAGSLHGDKLRVCMGEELRRRIPAGREEALLQVLRSDPRPGYQSDPDRVYGFAFAGVDVRFTVRDDVLTVCQIVPLEKT